MSPARVVGLSHAGMHGRRRGRPPADCASGSDYGGAGWMGGGTDTRGGSGDPRSLRPRRLPSCARLGRGKAPSPHEPRASRPYVVRGERSQSRLDVQARPSSKYLNSNDLLVYLRFTYSALSSRRPSHIVPAETESLWPPHLPILQSRSTPRLWPRPAAPTSGRRRASTAVFWPRARNGPSSGWPSTCRRGSIPII